MSGARSLKYRVNQLLREKDLKSALPDLRRHPPRRIVNALIAQFYDANPIVRWRSIAATGCIVDNLADSDRESARVVMRRFIWMLNDESGGIGWGAPEAMGEILARSDALAAEYGRILCSYMQPDQNYLEHPGLQRGLLWGLGRLAQKRPAMVRDILPELGPFMTSADAYHRGYAAWAAGNIGDPATLKILTTLTGDGRRIEFYHKDRISKISVGELAEQAISNINPTSGKD